jgi:biotin transport system substrate-specific component
MTATDIYRPSLRHHALAYDAACIMAGSLFIALSAQIAIFVPFSPVPITGQTLAALLVGALLGSRRGSLAVILYLAEGAFGLGVFAGGGAGLLRLAGPTGGYLAGLVPGAFVTGWLAERGWDRHVWTTILAMLAGNAVIYLCGLPWLAHFVGTGRVLAAGLLPFVPGDLVKVAVAAALLPAGWQLLGPSIRGR